MKDFPLVSVIIPMYNASRYIEETIQSVLDQTWSNIEIIVVDDGSTDNSYNIVSDINSNKIRLFHQENQGAPVARNFGFSQSKGDYIQYLDADDLLSPNKIEDQLQLLLCNDTCCVSFCPFVVYQDNQEMNMWENVSKTSHTYTSGFDFLVDLWTYYLPSYVPACYLLPRTLIEKTGPWDESLLKNQDGEYMSRVLLNTSKVCCSQNSKVLWRYVPTSISHFQTYPKLLSLFESYKKIANLMIDYENSIRVKRAISIAMGYLIYTESTYVFSFKIMKYCHSISIHPQYPNTSKVFKYLNTFFSPIFSKNMYHLIKRLFV